MQLRDDHLTENEHSSESAPQSDADLAEILVSAKEHSQHDDLEHANALYKRAMAYIDSLPEEKGHPHLAEVLWNLGNNMYMLSQIEECIPHFQRLVTLQEEKLGAEDPALITPLLRLAIALKRDGQAELSEQVFERSMTLAKKANPEGLVPSSRGQSTADSGDASTADGNSGGSDASAETQTTPQEKSADHEMLKHLFSANSPHSLVEEEPEQHFAQPEFVDRNPAATRLSEMDLAALSAIPSPSAMKTMFREAQLPDAASVTKAAAYLKEHDSSDEPVKFADSVKHFDAKESAPFMVRNQWLLPTLVISAVVIAAGYFLKDVLSHTKSVQTWDVLPGSALPVLKTFNSFDKSDVIQILSGDRAIYDADGKSFRAKCFSLHGDLRDLATVIPGAYTGRHIWFEESSTGVKRDDGGNLYLPDAPMSKVVEQMTMIANAVQQYYLKNHSYPTTNEQFQEALGSLSSHVNPLTHRGDAPRFYMTYANSAQASAPKLEEKTGSGETWINETSQGPGEIHCVSLISEDASGKPDPRAMAASGASGMPGAAPGTIPGATPGVMPAVPGSMPGTNNGGFSAYTGRASYFLIRGCDESGQFIQGSKPGQTFYIELNEGKSNIPDEQKVAALPRDFSKITLYLAPSLSEQSLFTCIAGAVPGLLVMVIAACLVMQHGMQEQKDKETVIRRRTVGQTLIVASILLAGWVLICVLG
ncbi:MAG TPA: tetratricopeptide repeat protein [Oculatellaceae cyanobacterium]